MASYIYTILFYSSSDLALLVRTVFNNYLKKIQMSEKLIVINAWTIMSGE